MLPSKEDIVGISLDRIPAQFQMEGRIIKNAFTTTPYPVSVTDAFTVSTSLKEGAVLRGALVVSDSFDTTSSLLAGASIRDIVRHYTSETDSMTGDGCTLQNISLVQTLFPVAYNHIEPDSTTGNGCTLQGITLVQTLFPVSYDHPEPDSMTGNGCTLLSITLT